MKLMFIIICLLFTLSSHCQKIEKFFDYKWNETVLQYARFFSLIEKTDSGWHRRDYFVHERLLQKDGMYTDSACKLPNGYFKSYHANKQLQSSGNYVNGKRDGLWLQFYQNGMIKDSTTFSNGNPVGTSLKWHRNGFISDSAVYISDGSGLCISWFDDGTPSSAGRLTPRLNEYGKWVYFHKSGKRSSEAIYNDGKLAEVKYFDEEGNIITDTSNRNKGSAFPGGLPAWQKYLQNSLYFPSSVKITNSDKAVVVVDAAIDENGKVCEVEVSSSFHPVFDKIALQVVNKSRDWIPALHHNRRVKSYIRQAITFMQE